MTDQPTNDAIRSRMLRSLRGSSKLAAAAGPAACDGFGIDDFAVTYPNGELIATLSVTGAPDGAAVLGVTVAASPGGSSPETYCMGVAYDAAGLSLPVSVLGASTAPAFSSATEVTGTVILCYQQDGETKECVTTRQFTVGG